MADRLTPKTFSACRQLSMRRGAFPQASNDRERARERLAIIIVNLDRHLEVDELKTTGWFGEGRKNGSEAMPVARSRTEQDKELSIAALRYRLRKIRCIPNHALSRGE
jgi:hypothetical protein